MNTLVLAVLLVLVLVFAVTVIVLHALNKKGDVSAALSLRSFKFSLRAKERKQAPFQATAPTELASPSLRQGTRPK
jgi:hypothetical protein